MKNQTIRIIVLLKALLLILVPLHSKNGMQPIAGAGQTFLLETIRTYATRTLIAASVGIAGEVAFTALSDYAVKRNPELKGKTYLWMFVIYACIYPLYTYVYPQLVQVPLVLRLLIYVGMIYTGEYLSGTLLRKLIGRCPWEKHYRNKRWSVHNLIRLDYAPAWLCAALIFEEVCHILHR